MIADDIVRALRGGPATLDALDARLGGVVREELIWAVDEAVARGLVHSTAGVDCGPDGICGTSAPAVFTLTPAGRASAPAAR
jgi:hypothetical protein